MKLYKMIIFIIALFAFAQSCRDIVDCDSNIGIDLIKKVMTPSDSLAVLTFEDLDLGNVKIRAVCSGYVRIRNNASDTVIKIYSVESSNKGGLFHDSCMKGLPFDINPGEDIRVTQKIWVKFIADAINPGYFYDTLTFNGNKDYRVAIKVRIFY